MEGALETLQSPKTKSIPVAKVVYSEMGTVGTEYMRVFLQINKQKPDLY